MSPVCPSISLEVYLGVYGQTVSAALAYDILPLHISCMLWFLLLFCYFDSLSFSRSLKCCSLIPAADSSDNSDLEDDIILALNEWFCRKRQWTCSTRLEPQRRSDRKMSSGSQPLFSAGLMRLWCGWSVRTPPLRTARIKQTAFVGCLFLVKFPSLNVWSSLKRTGVLSTLCAHVRLSYVHTFACVLVCWLTSLVEFWVDLIHWMHSLHVHLCMSIDLWPAHHSSGDLFSLINLNSWKSSCLDV